MQKTDVNVDIPGSLNTSDIVDLSVNPQLVSVVEETVSVAIEEPVDSIVYFFAVGLFVNLLLISVYFFWAYRQWHKKKEQGEK